MKNITWMMSPRNAYSDQDSMSWVVIEVSAGPVGGKGVPARESRTGIRLVSPAAGCEKKKDTSGRGPWIIKLSAL